MSFLDKFKNIFIKKEGIPEIIVEDDLDDNADIDQAVSSSADSDNKNIFHDIHDIDEENDSDTMDQEPIAPDSGKNKDTFVSVSLPGLEKEKAKELAEKVNSLPVSVFVVILALLVITVIGAGAFLVFNLTNMNTQAKEMNEKDNIDSIVVKQPSNPANNTNFIFVKQSNLLDGKNVVLTKMVADSLATVFYFDTYFDTQDHNIILSDNKDNIYTLDSAFSKKDNYNRNGNTVIRFAPLKEGTESFALNIQGILSGDTVSYGLSFEEPITYAPAKYMNDIVDIANGKWEADAKLYGAEFSSAGSIINFGFGENDKGETLNFISKKGADNIEMLQSGRRISPAKPYPDIYLFEENGRALGRMDFSALKSLQGEVKVNFNNVFKRVKVDQNIEASELFLNRPEAQKTIPVGDHNIVLERMGIRGDKCLLILHSEKNPIGVNVPEPERTEVQLETELIIKDLNGKEITIEGNCGSIKEGTDIVYDITDVKNTIRGIPYDNYTVKIKNALFRVDDISVDIDLDSYEDNLSEERKNALNSVQDSFSQRLSYKANGISKSEIKGFSDEILNDKGIMKNYEPIKGLSEAHYSTHVLTYSIHEAQLNAIIAESWQGITENKEINFFRTHKITAGMLGDEWVISSDSIAK